jgi:ABC-type sugar transport system substrate-binding protein
MRALPVLLLALVALGSATPAAAATTLGLVTPGTGSEAIARAAQAARSAAEEKGWTVEARDASVDGDALAQLVRREVAGLVLVAVRPEFDPAGVQAARAAGVPIVTVLAGASPAARFDLAVNQYALGADVGAYVLGRLGYRGRLITLRADADPGARARARVLDLMLQDAPGVALVASLDRGDGPEEAFRAALDRALAEAAGNAEASSPLAVWAATDALALLAEEALRARGLARERVTLVGVGGGPAALARLRDPAGLLTATAAIPYELLGEAAVDVLEDVAAGTPAEQIATGPYVFVDAVIVDQGSVPAEDELPW